MYRPIRDEEGELTHIKVTDNDGKIQEYGRPGAFEGTLSDEIVEILGTGTPVSQSPTGVPLHQNTDSKDLYIY